MILALLCASNGLVLASPLQSRGGGDQSWLQLLELEQEELGDFVHYQPQQTHLAVNGKVV